MTEQEEQLLLKDLCARLPYGVKYQTYLGDIFTLKDITLSRTSTQYYIDDNAFSLSQIKPYLRPMSSMTEEERLVYEQRLHDVGRSIDVIDADDVVSHIDWLNSHHFDYRGLIEKGLALEAPEGMYDTKTE